ncbi:MAG: IS200/IS605 family transposase [Akkermansiaceae bacterium]
MPQSLHQNYAHIVFSTKNRADHVHILLQTSKHIADTEFIRQLKGSSSRWMGEQGESKFQWQSGYGWFSVGAGDLDQARKYIENQKHHHKTMTYQDEFRKFLKQYGIDFDEKYVWD